MFKGERETKARTGPDVYVVSDGQRITRAEAEAFSQRGPWTPDQIRAAAHYGLHTPGGKPFGSLLPIEPTRDPLEATATEAPADKLGDLERARVAVESARAKTHEAAVARDLAWRTKDNEWRRKRDWEAFKRAEQAEKKAIARWQSLREDEEKVVREELAPVEWAIEDWKYLESLRRREAAYPPSPAPTGPNATVQTAGQPQGPPMITLS